MRVDADGWGGRMRLGLRGGRRRFDPDKHVVDRLAVGVEQRGAAQRGRRGERVGGQGGVPGEPLREARSGGANGADGGGIGAGKVRECAGRLLVHGGHAT